MATRKPGGPTPGGRELVISRLFAAPRELVWKAFTEPERLAQWWGPKGFTMLVRTLQLHPGGTFHYSMRAPDGHVLWGKFVYREIQPPERLVFVNSFADETGNIIRSPFNATWPLEILNVLTLQAVDGNTLLTLRGAPINANEEEHAAFWNAQDATRQGFAGTFDQLAAYLVEANRSR